MSPRDWPAVTKSVQSVINQTSLRKLGRRSADIPGIYWSSLEVFTGHRPVRPLFRAMPVGKYRMARTTYEIRARILLKIDQIRDALSQMNREANEISTAVRKRQVERHNRRASVRLQIAILVFNMITRLRTLIHMALARFESIPYNGIPLRTHSAAGSFPRMGA